MKVVNGDLFRRTDEQFGSDASVVEMIEDNDLNWNSFKVGDVVINCKENCKKASINLDGGVIDGNLTINGFYQKLASIKIIDIKAQKIAIYNLTAKKIEITGCVETIEIINSDADDYHICGEVSGSIILSKSGSEISSFELNGCAKDVELKNIIADDFRVTSFNCEKLKGEGLKINNLHLSTEWKSELRAVNVERLYLFNSKEATGVIYNLKNAALKF